MTHEELKTGFMHALQTIENMRTIIWHLEHGHGFREHDKATLNQADTFIELNHHLLGVK